MISANCVAGRDRGNGSPVLSARQFIGAATTALSLITGAFLLALAAGDGPARDQGAPGQTGRARLRGGEHLALAQQLESRKREPVLRLDREAVRRSARCRAVVAGVARGGARPLAQFPVQPSRPQRRR